MKFINEKLKIIHLQLCSVCCFICVLFVSSNISLISILGNFDVVVCVSTAYPTTCEPPCANGGTCDFAWFVCQCPCGWTGVACNGKMAVCIHTYLTLFQRTACHILRQIND